MFSLAVKCTFFSIFLLKTEEHVLVCEHKYHHMCMYSLQKYMRSREILCICVGA